MCQTKTMHNVSDKNNAHAIRYEKILNLFPPINFCYLKNIVQYYVKMKLQVAKS